MRQTAILCRTSESNVEKVGAEGSIEPQIRGSSDNRQAGATQLDDSGEKGKARAHDTVQMSHSDAEPVETRGAC